MPRYRAYLRLLRILLASAKCLFIDDFALLLNSLHKIYCSLLWAWILLCSYLQMFIHALRVVVLYLVLQMT